MIDLTGKKFNKLLAISRAKSEVKNGRKRAKWICLCDCGKTITVETYKIRNGEVVSCGCHKKDKKPTIEHKKQLYSIWMGMRRRCYEKKNIAYKYYGGRNIGVCDEWNSNFYNFAIWATQNGFLPNLTLDRIDCDKNYCPENCRWATMQEQNNNRRNNHYIIFNDKKYTLTSLANEYGIHPNTLYARLKAGIELKEALKHTGKDGYYFQRR